MFNTQRRVANARNHPHNANVRDPSEPSDEMLPTRADHSEREGATYYPVSGEVKAEVPEIAVAAMESRKEFEFSGVLASVPENREQVMEFVEKYCADEGDRLDLLVALQEALANAALHGCKDDPAKRIRCVVTAKPDEITIMVRDPGPGFDPDLADPEKYVATKLSHGRGICLMRSLVTDVSFGHHGAEVTLRKRLAKGE